MDGRIRSSQCGCKELGFGTWPVLPGEKLSSLEKELTGEGLRGSPWSRPSLCRSLPAPRLRPRTPRPCLLEAAPPWALRAGSRSPSRKAISRWCSPRVARLPGLYVRIVRAVQLRKMSQNFVTYLPDASYQALGLVLSFIGFLIKVFRYWCVTEGCQQGSSQSLKQ